MKRTSPQRVSRLLLCVAFGLCASFSTAGAEDATSAETSAEAEQGPPPIHPIPVEEVSAAAEVTVAEIDALLRRDAENERLDEIEEEVVADREQTAARIQTVAEALETKPKVGTLEDIQRTLRGLLEPLAAIDAELSEELKAISKASERADREAEVWKATLAEARATKASQATLSRIVTTQKQIEKARKAQLARRNRILTLRDRLVDPRSKIDDQLKRVQAELDGRLQGVLQSERKPMWSASVRESLLRELQENWREAIASQGRDVAAYVKTRPQGLAIQLAIFFVLLIGLRALDTRVRARQGDVAELVHANEVFKHPTAMAFVGAIAFTWELHPLAPAPFNQLMGAIVIIPSAQIVRRLLPEMTPVLVGIVVLFFADRVRGLLIALPTIERTLFVVQLLGALVFLIWMLQGRHLRNIPAELSESFSFRIVGAGIRVGVALLAVAALADIFGLGDLADLVGSAVLNSSYWGVFTFAVLRVAQSVFAYLLLVRPLSLLRGVARHRTLVRKRVYAGMKVAAWAIYVFIVLGMIGVRAPVLDILAGTLAASLSVGAVSISVGDVGALALTVYISFRLARLIDFLLNEDIFPRVALARGVPYAISNLVRYGVIFFGILVALAAAGIELSKLSLIVGGLGVGIGFGLQNIVNNFVSGLILLFERPLQVGDAVQLANGLWGEITRIGIRASIIRTFDGAEVIVPNGSLISEQVTNWTLSDHRRRIELLVGVEYGTDAQRVIDLLSEVATAHPEVLDDPGPAVHFMDFGDSSLDFRVRAWIGDFDRGFAIRSELAVAVQRALKEAGIGVPFPQRDLHLRSVSEGVASSLQEPRPPAPSGSPEDA